MPKTTTEDVIAFSVRTTPEAAGWLKSEADAKGLSINIITRQVIDDARTLYGLPQAMVAKLDEDAKVLGLDRRSYVMHLLTLRFEQVIKNGPGFDKSGGKKRG